jgi:hypothetical protein
MFDLNLVLNVKFFRTEGVHPFSIWNLIHCSVVLNLNLKFTIHLSHSHHISHGMHLNVYNFLQLYTIKQYFNIIHLYKFDELNTT